VAAVGVDDGRERAPVVDALALGAVEDPLEGTRVERGGDVEDRPRRARDANGVDRRDVGRCEVAGAMGAQARLPARPVPGRVTSISTASEARRPQSAAAEAWLSAAAGPHGRTAASQRPRVGTSGWPTA